MTVGGIVLAAGAGRRYGMAKALVMYDGALFVERAARTLLEAGCAPVVVVLGASSAEIRARAELTGVSVVDNPAWATGMGSSLRVGLASLSGSAAAAAVILPVDTPGVTTAAVRRIAGLGAAGALVRATYDGEPGHRVLLGRDHWAGASELATGDQGAREYLRRHRPVEVDCADIASGTDVDNPSDLPG